MIGPQNFADGSRDDIELAEQLTVPVEQVAIARREFDHLGAAVG